MVRSAGYASSLAAASLSDLGYDRAADLVGGYQAWRAWFTHRHGPGPQAEGIDPEASHSGPSGELQEIAGRAPA